MLIKGGFKKLLKTKEDNKNLESIECICKEAIVEYHNSNCGPDDVRITTQDVDYVWPYMVIKHDTNDMITKYDANGNMSHTILRFETVASNDVVYECVINSSTGQIYLQVLKRIGFKFIQN